MVTTKPYHWCCLLMSIGLEVGGTSIMKLSQSWAFPHAQFFGLAVMWCAIGLSYILLSRAVTGIPVGVSFACWEGLGLTCITLCGALFLDEPITLRRALGLACVLGGALLVNLGTGHGPEHSKEHGPEHSLGHSTEHGSAAPRKREQQAQNAAAYAPVFAAMKEEM